MSYSNRSFESPPPTTTTLTVNVPAGRNVPGICASDPCDPRHPPSPPRGGESTFGLDLALPERMYRIIWMIPYFSFSPFFCLAHSPALCRGIFLLRPGCAGLGFPAGCSAKREGRGDGFRAGGRLRRNSSLPTRRVALAGSSDFFLSSHFPVRLSPTGN